MVIVSFKTQLGQDFLCLDNNDQIKASTPLSLLTKCDCALCQVSCWLLVLLIMHCVNEMINQHFAQSQDIIIRRACTKPYLSSTVLIAIHKITSSRLALRCMPTVWNAMWGDIATANARQTWTSGSKNSKSIQGLGKKQGRLVGWPATNGDFTCQMSIVAPKKRKKNQLTSRSCQAELKRDRGGITQKHLQFVQPQRQQKIKWTWNKKCTLK